LLVPEIKDLTPADTSSYLKLSLADALREYHPYVASSSSPLTLEKDIAALLQQVEKYALVIIGTLNAYSQPGSKRLCMK
jgi:hypothetical protein